MQRVHPAARSRSSCRRRRSTPTARLSGELVSSVPLIAAALGAAAHGASPAPSLSLPVFYLPFLACCPSGHLLGWPSVWTLYHWSPLKPERFVVRSSCAAPSSADRQLIVLCAAFRVRLRLFCKAAADLDEVELDPRRQDQTAQLRRLAHQLLHEWRSLLRTIVATRAHHRAGRVAKSRSLAALRAHSGMPLGDSPLTDLALSLIDDLSADPLRF